MISPSPLFPCLHHRIVNVCLQSRILSHWAQDERSIQTHKAREPVALWLIFFYFDQTKVGNLLYLPGFTNRIGTHIPREQTVPRRADKADHENNAVAKAIEPEIDVSSHTEI